MRRFVWASILAPLAAASCSVGQPIAMTRGSDEPADASQDRPGSLIGVPDASPDTSGGDGPPLVKCAGTITKAKTDPLDMFIMLDQSGSMDVPLNLASPKSKWDDVVEAIKLFVEQPNSEGIGVGLQYFGHPPAGAKCKQSSCHDDGECGPGCGPCTKDPPEAATGVCDGLMQSDDSCDPADYASAAVPIAPLPGNAKAIVDSLALHTPYSSTPTGPALQGAIDFSRNWAAANASHIVVTVLATDGFPAGCEGDDIQRVAGIAKDGYASARSIRTYAIGIGTSFDNSLFPDAGTWLENLNLVAAAGGTGAAFPITRQVAELFLDALNRIRGTALGCAYLLPPPMGKPTDFGQVNFLHRKGGADATYIPKVANAAACAGQGWYYDDEKSPTRILTCDATCQELAADFTGQVEIEVGCPTVVN